MNVKRTIAEYQIFRDHNLKYQSDCLTAFLSQPIDELFKNMNISLWNFSVMIKDIGSHNFSDYYFAEKYLTDNNIDFPGKKEWFHFLLTEQLSGEGKF